MPAINRALIGGSLFGTGSITPDFDFAAKDLTVGVRLSDAGSFPFFNSVVTAGSSFNASGTLAGDQTLNNGMVEFQGVCYPSLFFTGTLQFTATPVLIPANSAMPLQLSTKFTFGGTFNAYPNNPFSGPPGPAVFEATLEGKGTAVVRCSASYPLGTTTVRDVTSLFFGFE
jgi:hypothetical protein